jgi:hypothetical protein
LTAKATASDFSPLLYDADDSGIAVAIELGPQATKSSPGAPFVREIAVRSAVAPSTIGTPTTSQHDPAADSLSLDGDLVTDPAEIDAELLELLVGLRT